MSFFSRIFGRKAESVESMPVAATVDPAAATNFETPQVAPPGSTSPPPESPEASQARADRIQRNLNTLVVGEAMAKEPGMPSVDAAQIASLEDEKAQLGRAGITPTIAPVASTARFNAPLSPDASRRVAKGLTAEPTNASQMPTGQLSDEVANLTATQPPAEIILLPQSAPKTAVGSSPASTTTDKAA